MAQAILGQLLTSGEGSISATNSKTSRAIKLRMELKYASCVPPKILSTCEPLTSPSTLDDGLQRGKGVQGAGYILELEQRDAGCWTADRILFRFPVAHADFGSESRCRIGGWLYALLLHSGVHPTRTRESICVNEEGDPTAQSKLFVRAPFEPPKNPSG